MGRCCARQFLVDERQHPRETARVSALSRSRGHRRLSQAMCGDRGEGLRGLHPRLAAPHQSRRCLVPPTVKTASSLPLERSQPTWSEVRLTLRWRKMDSNFRYREAERLKGITISIASTAVLGPGRPDENAERVSKPDTSRARAANIGLPANRRAGTTWSRVRRRPCRKRRPAHARRPRHDPPHREKIATPEIRCAKNSEPRRSIRKTAPRRTSRFGNPSAVSGRISLPPSLSCSSQASAGRVAPALT